MNELRPIIRSQTLKAGEIPNKHLHWICVPVSHFPLTMPAENIEKYIEHYNIVQAVRCFFLDTLFQQILWMLGIKACLQRVRRRAWSNLWGSWASKTNSKLSL